MDLAKTRELIVLNEGFKQFPYKCPADKLTIGFGRNLEDKGIVKEEADYLLTNDINGILRRLAQQLPFFAALDEPTQAVLVDIAFNIGVTGLLSFAKMLGFLAEDKRQEASRELLNSRLATQVSRRTMRNADILIKKTFNF